MADCRSWRRLMANTSTASRMNPPMMASATVMTSSSEVEDVVDALTPGQDEVEAFPAEERSDQDEHRPEHHEEGHQGDGELPVLGLVGRVLVDPAGDGERTEPNPGDGHARDHRVEHRQELLKPQEVPGSLGRVFGEVEVGHVEQRRVDEGAEDEEKGGHGQG